MTSLLHDCLCTHYRGDTTAAAPRVNTSTLLVSSRRSKLLSVRPGESQLPLCQCRRSQRGSSAARAALEEASTATSPDEPRDDDVCPLALSVAPGVVCCLSYLCEKINVIKAHCVPEHSPLSSQYSKSFACSAEQTKFCRPSKLLGLHCICPLAGLCCRKFFFRLCFGQCANMRPDESTCSTA